MTDKVFIYHYSARYSVNNGVADIDGIARLISKVKCMDDYHQLKKSIDPDNFSKLTIVSLSFIGMENK